MPTFWPSLPDGETAYTNGNGEQKCPGCPLAGNIGVDCINKNQHVGICIPIIQDDDPEADTQSFCYYRALNTAAWQTHGTGGEIHQEFYIEGDAEAHDPEIGPGNGEPIDP